MKDSSDIMSPAHRVGRVLPDAIFATLFWLAWIAPQALGLDDEWLEAVFIAQMASVMLAAFLMIKVDLNGLAGTIVAWVVMAVASITIVMWSNSIATAIGALVPFLWLGWSVFELMYSTEITTVERRMRTSYAWIGILCLLVALIIVVTFPIPGLGSTEKTSAARTSLVAMGSLYFTSVAVLKYRWRPGWPIPHLPARKRI